jgi:hypothetical protein
MGREVMGISRFAVARFVVAAGVIAASVGSGACIVNEIPACPGQCFEYTVEYEGPLPCNTVMGDDYEIPFTGSAPDGYHGRFCFNSSSIPLVLEAIEHLESGGQLSELSVEVQNAYITTVNAVQADLQAECITAAAGQCIDEVQVCTGIAADMYEQLVVDETCVLALGGVEPIVLGPGEACEFAPYQATGSAESGEHCTDETTGGGGSDGADETTGGGGSDGADETTGDSTGMMLGPFGDIEALVRCDRQSHCDVERELVSNLVAHFDVFAQERVTLTIVGKDAPCGPGARIDGLDPREYTTELAAAFGLRNGDVIHELEATTLEDLGAAMDAVASLLEDPSTTIVLQRPEGLGCETLTIDIDVL